MMQIKIIRIRGQCRGRPPTTIREGPDRWDVEIPDSGFHIPGDGILELWNFGTMEPSGVKRRWGEPRSVGSHQLAAGSRRSAARNLKVGIWNPGSGIPDPEAYGFHISRARDWVNYTCSVSFIITRDRDKDRSVTIAGPAEKWRDRRSMPFSEEPGT